MFVKSILVLAILGFAYFGTTLGQIGYGNPSINVSNPDEIAKIAAKSFTPMAFKYFKIAFAVFAPDSWCDALEKIPFQSLRCVIRVSTREQLIAQSKNTTIDQNAFNETLTRQCTEYNRICAFGRVINETIAQLPDHVTQILTTFGYKFQGVQQSANMMNDAVMNATLYDFLVALKSITPAERQKMAELFPKISSVILDPRLDQLFDFAIQSLGSDRTVSRNASSQASKLATQIFSGLTIQLMSSMAKMNKSDISDYSDVDYPNDNALNKRRRRGADGEDGAHYEVENGEPVEEKENDDEENSAKNKKRSADQPQMPQIIPQIQQGIQSLAQAAQTQFGATNPNDLMNQQPQFGQPQPQQPQVGQPQQPQGGQPQQFIQAPQPPNNGAIAYSPDGKPLQLTGGAVPNVVAPVVQPLQQQNLNPNQPQQQVQQPAPNMPVNQIQPQQQIHRKRSVDQPQVPAGQSGPAIGNPQNANSQMNQLQSGQPQLGQSQPQQIIVAPPPPNNAAFAYSSNGKPLHFTGGEVPKIVAPPVQQQNLNPNQPQQQNLNPNQPQQQNLNPNQPQQQNLNPNQQQQQMNPNQSQQPQPVLNMPGNQQNPPK